MLPRALHGRVWISAILAVALVATVIWLSLGGSKPTNEVVVVVMDPLAKQLACPCVAGYGQRDYDQLGAYLAPKLGRPVRVVYAEALAKALLHIRRDSILFIIGKQSLVKADAQESGLSVHPLALLTGWDGTTTITGLFIVKTGDPAKTTADLKGRRILFGLADSDEKHAAALAALRSAGISMSSKLETRSGCSDAAVELQDSTETPPPAAVISSYALPLLEGCGNVERGTLRVVGQTAPVPFITVFAGSTVPPELEIKFSRALSAVQANEALLKAIESRNGFVSVPPAAAGWPGWRGANRDGHADWLPHQLPAAAKFAWRHPLNSPALAGVAAAEGVVIVADRDAAGEQDVFHCLRFEDGRELWQVKYPAKGNIDYGPSPRATPLIHDGRVYLLGAWGALFCVDRDSGQVIWQKDLVADFGAPMPKWGYCASPLVVDDKLIICPGAPNAAVVALNRLTGGIIWKTSGAPAAYAALICDRFGGRRQIVGYDAISLGGWDPQSGRRLWTLIPPRSGDFNVPTPIAVNGRLLVASENNGTRLYDFRDDGTIIPTPLARSEALAPDASSPVIVAGQVVGCAGGLHGLDLNGQLKTLWANADEAFADFASLIASGDRLLAATFNGELWLLKPTSAGVEVVSRLRVFADDAEIYSHPALAEHRLFLRGRDEVVCLPLDFSALAIAVSNPATNLR